MQEIQLTQGKVAQVDDPDDYRRMAEQDAKLKVPQIDMTELHGQLDVILDGLREVIADPNSIEKVIVRLTNARLHPADSHTAEPTGDE